MQVIKDYLDSITAEEIKLLPCADWRKVLDGNIFTQKSKGYSYQDVYTLRDEYIRKIGFPIYTQETVDTLIEYLDNKKVLEVGSGSGFLAKILSLSGINMTAVDNKASVYIMGEIEDTHWGCVYKNDFNNDAIQHLKIYNAFHPSPPSYDVVMMCWPDYRSNFASDIAKLIIPGQTLIYQGEGSGGCTGNEEFHDLVMHSPNLFKLQEEISDKLNETHAQFSGIHDYWSVYTAL